MRCSLSELGAEAGDVGDPEDVPQELLLADGALMCARVDLTGEVLAERADAGELAAGDLRPQLAEAALVVRGERRRGDSRRGLLHGIRARCERERRRGGDCQRGEAVQAIADHDDLPGSGWDAPRVTAVGPGAIANSCAST